MRQIVFTSNEIVKIKELYSDGLSCVRIGKIFNVSKTPITKTIDTNQLTKIKWVNENIKPVEIIVIDKRNNKIIKKEII